MATNCNEATIQGSLYITCTKNLIDENLKLLWDNNKLVDDEMPAPLPGIPDPLNKDTNKISDIVLIIIRKIWCDT